MKFLLSFIFAAAIPLQCRCQEVVIFETQFDTASLIRELFSNPPYRKRVGCSDSQIEQLKKIATKREYSKLTTTATFGIRSRSGDGQFEADQALQRLVSDVLTEKQIIEMKKVYVQSRFADKFDTALLSQFASEFCEIDRYTERKYRDSIKTAVADNVKAIELSNSRSIQRILAAVPKQSTDMLAQLVGSKHFPVNVIRNDLDASTLPLPASVKTIDIVPLILDPRGELHKKVNLTERQIDICARIRGEYDKAYNSIMATHDIDYIMSAVDNLDKKNPAMYDQIDKILSNEQKLAIGRYANQVRLEQVPNNLFNEPGVKEYLGMSAQEWTDLMQVVKTEVAKQEEELNAINKKMLDDVGKEMGPAIEKRLQYLFGDVW